MEESIDLKIGLLSLAIAFNKVALAISTKLSFSGINLLKSVSFLLKI